MTEYDRHAPTEEELAEFEVEGTEYYDPWTAYGGICIPAWLFGRGLKPTAILFYAIAHNVLADNKAGDHVVEITNEKLVEDATFTLEEVEQALTQLTSAGLLDVLDRSDAAIFLGLRFHEWMDPRISKEVA